MKGMIQLNRKGHTSALVTNPFKANKTLANTTHQILPYDMSIFRGFVKLTRNS